MRTRHTILLTLLLLVAFAVVASAQPSRHAYANKESGCRIEKDEVFSLPAILADQRAVMAGRVNDLWGFAQHATVSGVVEDNAYFFAQTLEVTGSVLGDLHVFCQHLIVTGDIGGDIYCWGGEIEIDPEAVVHGNVVFGAGILTVEGKIAGEIKGGGGEVIILGELLGPSDLGVGRLEIGPEAHIVGDLTYTAAQEADVAEGARIEGDITFHEDIHVVDDSVAEIEREEKKGFGWFGFLQIIASYLGVLVLGVVLLAVLRRHARKPSEVLNRQPGLTLGVGFLVFIVTPVAAVISIALILPMPLGFVGLLLYVTGLLLAGLVVALWLGGRLLGWMGKPGEPGYGALALGLAALWLLGMIPYLGFLVKLIMLVAGLGGIVLALTGRNGKREAVAL